MPAVSFQHVIHIGWYARPINRNSHPLICRVNRLLHCWFPLLTTRSQNQTHQVLKYYSVETTRKPLLTFNLDLLVERCWGSWTHGAPASLQVYSAPQSRRRHSQKARQSCSLKLVGWMTGRGSPWTLGTPGSLLYQNIFQPCGNCEHLKLCLICDKILRNLWRSHVSSHKLLVIGSHDLKCYNLKTCLYA